MTKKELKCIYCKKGCGQCTHDSMLAFRGHFVCSECFESRTHELKEEDNLEQIKVDIDDWKKRSVVK